MNNYKLGLDVGSTTIKTVLLNSNNKCVFSTYERHHAKPIMLLINTLDKINNEFGDILVNITISGSVGMGISERFEIPFVQEVVACTEYVKEINSEVSLLIDIGGEDAKIVSFLKNGSTDLRMNGNCSGGTGAFIDQICSLIGISPLEMNELAKKSTKIHPIASRCGVFSKTDVQNLLSKNVEKCDIAASVFRAVVVQVVTTLMRGNESLAKVLFLGGPLSFLSELEKSFCNFLRLEKHQVLDCENSHLLTAFGAANKCIDQNEKSIIQWITAFSEQKNVTKISNYLEPLFLNEFEHKLWTEDKSKKQIVSKALNQAEFPLYLGIDSGSTTTKIVVIDSKSNIVFHYYADNKSGVIETVKIGLNKLAMHAKDLDVEISISGSCVTGYGEDLIKEAFGLDFGVVETIAHYLAAEKIVPNVSFILDIGGQDMKAMFVKNGAIERLEINEACSSGCGSFIQTYAESMNYSVQKFAQLGCLSKSPFDLGTRCTVFMNSKVKQAMREDASVADISAGLSYSVIKNCLHKVLKIKSIDELGDNIVLQGGTMRNDAIVKAFENTTNKTAYRSHFPELMGAFGSALTAKNNSINSNKRIEDLLKVDLFEDQNITCKGCENRCFIKIYKKNNDTFYTGHKCEKIFSNKGSNEEKAKNLSYEKQNLLFNRNTNTKKYTLKIGLARGLNMFENYPFWHALFSNIGFQVVLSDVSTIKTQENSAQTVMSDNICFPAKLLHGHIENLIVKKVDRIFLPYIVYEKQESKTDTNSFNCPIVTGYSDVIKSAITTTIPIDDPVFSFKNKEQVENACLQYLSQFNVSKKKIENAINAAFNEQIAFENELIKLNKKVFEAEKRQNNLTILLAGRPYHTDEFIQNKLSEMIVNMGVTVITEDIVRNSENLDLSNVSLVSQWSYPNRVIKAALWAAKQPRNVQMVLMTSFGCGPDAFIIDQLQKILKNNGKNLTLIKLDDVQNMGSVKLRIRSLIESLKFANQSYVTKSTPYLTTKEFLKEDNTYKIIAPHFDSFTAEILPEFFKVAGYDLEILPEPDQLSVEYGLKFVNNEVCYPASIVIGDILKALHSGKYDINKTAVLLTQTGGQCRATSYLSLLKQSLVDAGLAQVPVLSLATTDLNKQSGFEINWAKLFRIIFASILFTDALSKLYYASVVREKEVGAALLLKKKYLEDMKPLIRGQKLLKIIKLLKNAVADFTNIVEHREIPKVAIVGEIYVKFNGFANKNIDEWLIQNKVELVPPTLLGFFMQYFVNTKINKKEKLIKDKLPNMIRYWIYKLLLSRVGYINKILAPFPYLIPFTDIFFEAEHAKKVISLHAQFGEGWLLPAEIISYVEAGVPNVISLQPFGCIANHVVAKGIENKLKEICPNLNLLFLDFDGNISDVNMENRLHLFLEKAKK